MTKLEKRLGPRHDALHAGEGRGRHGRGESGEIHRRGQAFILLAVTLGVSIVLGLLYSGNRHIDPPAAVPIAMCIIGATIAALLTYFRFVNRSTLEMGNVFHRLAYAGVAGLFLVPAYLITMEEVRDRDLAAIVFGPIAALLLCDFTKRIEAGRAGQVSGGSAFWAGVVGMVATALAGGDDAMFIGAGVTAAVSLLTQAGAAMWPLKRMEPETGILGAQHSPLRERVGWAEIHHEAESGSGGRAHATEDGPHEEGDAMAGGVAAAEQQGGRQAETQAHAPATRLDVPSFAGRTVNAGVSFIAKTLMLIGLVLAIAQPPAHLAYARGMIDFDGPLADLMSRPIPPGIALAPLALGSVLLILARRRGSGCYLLRTFIGCLMVFVGSIFAMVMSANSIYVLFTVGEPNRALDPGVWGPMIPSVALLGIGLLLLLWPRRDANKPIVV